MNMASTVIDSPFLGDLYGTPEMRTIFSADRLLQKWLDVEAALAQAQGELGVIPAPAADEIRRQARAGNINYAQVKRGVDETVHPIVPVIRALQAVCAGDAGEYIHWGATTQDIMDTAMILQLKEAIAIFERRLQNLRAALAAISAKYRDALMPGRTHGQHALPVTFGYKTAIWLAEVERHAERLAQLKPRLLVGQFGGAVGTLASLGERAQPVRERLMALLGLGTPVISWHTARDNLAEFAGWTALLSATLGKIASEVIHLQTSEVAEVEEPWNEGKVGSSTMPHKRNPMLCEAALALARLVLRLAPSSLEAMIQTGERDWSADHVEWAYLPEVCIYTDGALNLVERVLGDLQVYPQKMRSNLELTGGHILSEAVMLALAAKIGRQTAHEAVYRCAMRAYQKGLPFAKELAEDALIRQHLDEGQIQALLDPAQYTGLAGEFVDRVLGGRED